MIQEHLIQRYILLNSVVSFVLTRSPGNSVHSNPMLYALFI